MQSSNIFAVQCLKLQRTLLQAALYPRRSFGDCGCCIITTLLLIPTLHISCNLGKLVQDLLGSPLHLPSATFPPGLGDPGIQGLHVLWDVLEQVHDSQLCKFAICQSAHLCLLTPNFAHKHLHMMQRPQLWFAPVLSLQFRASRLCLAGIWPWLQTQGSARFRGVCSTCVLPGKSLHLLERGENACKHLLLNDLLRNVVHNGNGRLQLQPVLLVRSFLCYAGLFNRCSEELNVFGAPLFVDAIVFFRCLRGLFFVYLWEPMKGLEKPTLI